MRKIPSVIYSIVAVFALDGLRVLFRELIPESPAMQFILFIIFLSLLTLLGHEIDARVKEPRDWEDPDVVRHRPDCRSESSEKIHQHDGIDGREFRFGRDKAHGVTHARRNGLSGVSKDFESMKENASRILKVLSEAGDIDGKRKQQLTQSHMNHAKSSKPSGRKRLGR